MSQGPACRRTSRRVFTREEAAWAGGMLHDVMDRAESALPVPELPRTADEWLRMRRRLRARLLDTLGVVPSETCPLDPRTLGVTERSGYRVERVVFNSRPDCPVPANLYLPARVRRPAPAVLCPHGHAQDGKAHRLYQRHHITLARKGYVVLSFDMVGFGERAAMGHRHAYAPFLHGGSLIGMILWDGLKALDYLVSRPEVDPARIGCTGNSGGGKQTIFLSALDDRVAVSVPAGYSATYRYTAAKERHICACNMAPGFLRFGELDLVFGMIAPRPLLMLMGRDDRLFPFDSVQHVFRRTRRIYRLLGAEDRVDLALCDCGHPYDLPKRQVMYAWFNRFLMGNTDPQAASEPRLRTERPGDAAVTCFPGGVLPDGAATAAELAARDGQSVLRRARRRLDRKGGVERARRDLRQLLWPDGKPRAKLSARTRGKAQTGDGTAEKVLIFLGADVALPCVLHAQGRRPSSVVVVVDDRGKSSPRARRATRRMMSEGHAVAAVDLRGWGESRGTELSEDGELDEHVAAQRGLTYGLPLMGLRVFDLLCVRNWARQRWPSCRVGLWGGGLGAVAACLAAAADRGFDFLTCRDIPATFLPPRCGDPPYPLSFYLHGILRVGDVADILRLASPTRVEVESALSVEGRRVAGASIEP